MPKLIQLLSSECSGLSRCAGIAYCIAVKTKTIPVPPSTAACPTTPTTVDARACETACQRGCRYQTSTFWETLSPSEPTLAARSAAAPSPGCLTTVWRSPTAATGMTVTYHPLTQTRISLVPCAGCSLVIAEMQGAGPAVTHTATVTDSRPAIVTTYACQ
jgi:hypothetical protein